MTTATNVSFKDPTYQIQKVMAIGVQSIINLLQQLEQQCIQRNYILTKNIFKNFINLMSCHLDTLIDQVTFALKDIISKDIGYQNQNIQYLKEQLVKQKKKNQTMKVEVLQLKQLVANHLKDTQTRLKDKDSIIELLTSKLINIQQSQQKQSNHNQSIINKCQSNGQISIIDQDSMVGGLTDKQQLEIIAQQQELFATSRRQSPTTKQQPQQKTFIKYKTQPNQVINQDFENQKDICSQSYRKSQNRSKTKFFLNDFRKIISAQNYTPICVALSKDSSKLISATSSQSVLSVARNQAQNFNAPYQSSPPKKLFPKSKKSQLMNNFNKKHKIKFISSPNHSQKALRKQNQDLTQNNLLLRKPRSASGSISKDRLKQKDLNVNLSRPSSKQKISLTIKTEQIKLKSYQDSLKQPNFKKILEKQCLLLDLSVGSQPIRTKYLNSRRGGGIVNGIAYYQKNLRYEGQFKDNMRHGFGTLYCQDIEIFKGDWQRNKICGKGKLQNINLINQTPLHESSLLLKMIYQGEFQQNRLHGYGQLLFVNNQKIKVWFHDNYPQRIEQYFPN